ncbi:MAG: hypothetical protein IJ560_02900 [Alphaproteobacteria bacterium]|nr:hypothetical protein [Alphaproteobacteria bacterium]
MNGKIVEVLRVLFPFALTLFLWRMEHPFWNPGGFLAIIPIFYCSFILRIAWFPAFSVIMCFLLDYNFSSHFFWTGLYCLVYAANGFQDLIDITRLERNAIGAFMVFLFAALFIPAIINISWNVVLRTIWCYVFATLVYFPLSEIIRGVKHD